MDVFVISVLFRYVGGVEDGPLLRKQFGLVFSQHDADFLVLMFNNYVASRDFGAIPVSDVVFQAEKWEAPVNDKDDLMAVLHRMTSWCTAHFGN